MASWLRLPLPPPWPWGQYRLCSKCNYEFNGFAYYRTVGTAACPPEKQAVRSIATWEHRQGLAGTARETISQQFEFAGWQEFNNGKVVSNVHKFVPDAQLDANPGIELQFRLPVWYGMLAAEQTCA